MYRFFSGQSPLCLINFHCAGKNSKGQNIFDIEKWFRTTKLIYRIQTTSFFKCGGTAIFLNRCKWMVRIRNEPQTIISIRKKHMATKKWKLRSDLCFSLNKSCTDCEKAILLLIYCTQRKNRMHVFLSLDDLRIKIFEKFNFRSKILWKFSI